MNVHYGHNQGPAFNPELIADLSETTDKFLKVSQDWLDLEKIENEQQAGQLTDQIDGLRGLYKRIDAARKDAKKPHDEAVKQVQDAFNPLLKTVKTCADELLKKMAEYKAEQERVEAERRAKAEAEARKRAEEAERLRKEAEASNNLKARLEAEAAEQRAAEAEKEANRKTETGVKSASGAGRTLSYRTERTGEITNFLHVAVHYRERPELHEFLLRLINADIRAKDVDATKIPGIKIIERKVVI